MEVDAGGSPGGPLHDLNPEVGPVPASEGDKT
jgi:hypothetical protein